MPKSVSNTDPNKGYDLANNGISKKSVRFQQDSTESIISKLSLSAFAKLTPKEFQEKNYKGTEHLENMLDEMPKHAHVADVACHHSSVIQYYYLIKRYVEFNGKAEKIIEYCKKALSQIGHHDIDNHRVAFFYERLMHSLNQLERYDECIEWGEKLSDYNPYKNLPLNICYELAIASRIKDLNRFQNVIKYVNHYYRLSSPNVQLDQDAFRICNFLNGLALISEKMIDEALPYLENGFKDPESMKSDLLIRYSDQLAYCYFRKERYKEAVLICQDGLKRLKSCEKTNTARFFIARLYFFMTYATINAKQIDEAFQNEFQDTEGLRSGIQHEAEMYYFYALTAYELGLKEKLISWLNKGQSITTASEDLKQKFLDLSLKLNDPS